MNMRHVRTAAEFASAQAGGCQRRSVLKEESILAFSHEKKPLNCGHRVDFNTLKERYLQCFGVRADNAALLQAAVRELIGAGFSRRTLVAWAVQAGYSQGYVSSLLSRIFVSLGLRERQPGAGRRPSAAALELLAHARNLYGDNFLKVLRAAWRAGKPQRAVVKRPTESGHQSSGLIVVPQLEREPNQTSKTMTMNSLL